MDVTPQEGITSAKFNWKQASVSIAISGREARQNSGKNQIINLLEKKTMQAEMTMSEKLNEYLYASGTTDAGSALHGLATIVATTGTVGGISKSVYSWWQSQTGTAASFAANGLDEMRNIMNDCSQFRASDRTDLIITTQTEFERLEKTLQPQERFTQTEKVDPGIDNLLFKKVPVAWDPYCTSGKMYFLNTKYLEIVVHKDAQITPGDFVKPENQDAKVSQILLMAELTCSNCAKQGVLTISAA